MKNLLLNPPVGLATGIVLLAGSSNTGKEQQWENRAHFFAATAEAMRRILDRIRQESAGSPD